MIGMLRESHKREKRVRAKRKTGTGSAAFSQCLYPLFARFSPVLLIGILFLFPVKLYAQDAAPESTLTIELVDGAALLTGPRADIDAVEAAIASGDGAPWTIERLRAVIREQSPQLAAQYFIEADITGAGALRVELPLRRAVLTGLVPPVELLPQDDARAVLGAAGFLAVSPDEWRALSEAQRIAAAARQPVAVFTGTDPTDTIIVIQSESTEQN